MAAFSAISAKDIHQLQDALDIYADSFPVNERHPAEVIRERVAAEGYTLMVDRQQGEIVFFALLWPLRGTEFVLLDYLATKKTHRGEGIGAAFLKSVPRLAEFQDKFLLMEVEDPTRGENREERAWRAQFYRRQGAKDLQGVRYVMPGLSGGTLTEMILMVLPPRSEAELDAAAVRQVITQIYKELYNRDSGDRLLNSFIGEIGAGPIKLGG